MYVIQECENPAHTQDKHYKAWATNYLWTGDLPQKGLGIFARQGIALQQLNWPNLYEGYPVKHFLPCSLNSQLTLLAVWAHHNNSPTFGYIGQVWKYLQLNGHRLHNALLAGDFNSNAIWDTWDRWWNHSDVVRALQETGIESLYHSYTKEAQGQETQATLYHQRKTNKPYHIDYIFGSQEAAAALKQLLVGEPKTWLQHSDHMPLYCEL